MSNWKTYEWTPTERLLIQWFLDSGGELCQGVKPGTPPPCVANADFIGYRDGGFDIEELGKFIDQHFILNRTL